METGTQACCSGGRVACVLARSCSAQVAVYKFLCASAQRKLLCASCPATLRKLLCASCSPQALCASGFVQVALRKCPAQVVLRHSRRSCGIVLRALLSYLQAATFSPELRECASRSILESYDKLARRHSESASTRTIRAQESPSALQKRTAPLPMHFAAHFSVCFS